LHLRGIHPCGQFTHRVAPVVVTPEAWRRDDILCIKSQSDRKKDCEAIHPAAFCYERRRAWRDGTTHIVMSPLEFMQRLAALVPRPRLHLIRFHGVLAPNKPLRIWARPALARSGQTASE